MKYITISLALFLFLVISPISVSAQETTGSQTEAEKRAALISQINSLLELIAVLQARLNTETQQEIADEEKAWARQLSHLPFTDESALVRGIPTTEWYAQIEQPSETSNLGTLDVYQVDETSSELRGTITPPSNCATGYTAFFRLEAGDGIEYFLYAPSCDEAQYSIGHIYQPTAGLTYGLYSPAINLISLDDGIIQNFVQDRQNVSILQDGTVLYR